LGSTAYNLAAGGKSLPLGSKKTAVTPILTFRGNSKGMLAGDKLNISVNILSKQGDVWEIADGCLIKPAASLTKISRKKASCRIIFPATQKSGGKK